jgi:hypothetical protein
VLCSLIYFIYSCTQLIHAHTSPPSHPSFNNLGLALKRTSQWEAAEACYVHAILNISAVDKNAPLRLAAALETNSLLHVCYANVETLIGQKDWGAAELKQWNKNRVSDATRREKERVGDKLKGMILSACAHCKAESTVSNTTRLSACSGCRAVYYCSVACQRLDW